VATADPRGIASGDAASALEAEHHTARRVGAIPNPQLVLHEDASRMSLVRSIRYIFSIPSNALMIIGSSLGYFYLAGLQTFALLFVKATTTRVRPWPNWCWPCLSSAR
jgi:hypothetical protein